MELFVMALAIPGTGASLERKLRLQDCLICTWDELGSALGHGLPFRLASASLALPSITKDSGQGKSTS